MLAVTGARVGRSVAIACVFVATVQDRPEDVRVASRARLRGLVIRAPVAGACDGFPRLGACCASELVGAKSA